MDRREFVRSAAAGAVALSVGAVTAVAGSEEAKKMPELEKRPLGRTGESLAVIGFGGIVVARVSRETSDEYVREAVEKGVNYFDVAPSYADAEDMLGPSLEPWRKDIFLSCKTTRRDREGAREEMENSLRKLRTDHFDLYNLHAITTKEDVETAFAPGGAMEAFLAARDEGKIRFLGFSAHSPEAALLALEKFDFDAFLYPVNWSCDLDGGFSDEVFKKAEEKGCGVIALKTLCDRPWRKEEERNWGKCWYKPVDSEEMAALALKYTLSRPVTVAIPPGEGELFRLALQVAPGLEPLTEAERLQLADLARQQDALFRA